MLDRHEKLFSLDDIETAAAELHRSDIRTMIRRYQQLLPSESEALTMLTADLAVVLSREVSRIHAMREAYS